MPVPIVPSEYRQPELCLRGYLKAIQVPDGIDTTAPDFNPDASQTTEEKIVFLEATDRALDDPDTHPLQLIIHGTDRAAAPEACQHGDWGYPPTSVLHEVTMQATAGLPSTPALHESPFSRYEVIDGFVRNETPKPVASVYRYCLHELQKYATDGEPLIDEYFSDIASREAPGALWPLHANWIAVFAVTGGSEGHYVHVEAIHSHTNTRQLLFLAKTFRGFDHAMRIVAALSTILAV
jgi:hypothetical protein